jgi:hypothetical protein
MPPRRHAVPASGRQSVSAPGRHSPGRQSPDRQPLSDALLASAGLARSRRDNTPRLPRAERLETAGCADLARPAPVPQVAANGVHWLPVTGWNLPWLWSGFSTRLGGLSRAYCSEDASGELNLGFTSDDDRETVTRNRRLLAEAVTGNPATPLISVRQFHSNLLVVADAGDAAREQPRKADGILSAQPGLLLGVQTADCVPVLVADRKRRVVGAFHAGWRGTVKRIVETGVGRMRLEFGSRPADLIAAIGPGIGPCCYSVGEEVLSEFESQFAYGRELFHEVYDSDTLRLRYPMLFLTQCAPGHGPAGTRLHVDLIEANRRQLLDCGISPKSIQVVSGCTQCNPGLFFSHRGSGGRTGRMMAVIGIRDEAGKRRPTARRPVKRKPYAR